MRAKQLEAWDVGVVTTDEFGEATPLDQSWEGIAASLLPVMEEGTVPVVTGFIGKPRGRRLAGHWVTSRTALVRTSPP